MRNDYIVDYLIFVNKICSVLEEYESCEVMILGGFNTKLGVNDLTNGVLQHISIV